jgi:hypothetical protein
VVVVPDVEFSGRDSADAAREEWEEWVCPLDDDKRKKTVSFVSDTPESVREMIEVKAMDSRGEQTTSHTADLSEREREKISDVGGFDQSTTIFNWRSAKGVFAREGLSDQFEDSIGALSDYDGPEEGAEEYIHNARQSDAHQGTSSVSGGSMDDGAEETKQQQRAANAARKAMDQGCDHARKQCDHDAPGACEHLKTVCGYTDEEVATILDGQEQPVEDRTDQRELVTVGGEKYPKMDVTPEQAGALGRSWF